MSLTKKRFGAAIVLMPLLALGGCSGSTEIPLAKVAPVSVVPTPPRKPSPYSKITSPDILPGQNR